MKLKDYKLIHVNSTIKGDPLIQKTIDNFKQEINTEFLARYGWNYDKIIGRTNWDLTMAADESPIGNLIADSIRWYVNKIGLG